MAIAKLIVKFLGDDKALKQSYKNAKKEGDKFIKQTKKDFGGLKKSIAASFAGIAGGVGVGAFTKNIAGSSRELSVWSDTLGTSVEDLQKWQFAAKSVGFSSEKLTDIFKDVNDKIGEFVTTGGGQAADVLKRLGFQAKDFKGLRPEEALIKIGKALKGLSAQEKVTVLESIANDASKLSPLLENNGQKLRELLEDYDALGLGISDNGVKVFKKFDGQLTKTTDALKAFGSSMAEKVVPSVNTTLEAIENLIKKFGGAREAGSKTFKVIGDAGKAVAKIFEPFTKPLGILAGGGVKDDPNAKFTPNILSREGLTKSTSGATATKPTSQSAMEQFRQGSSSFGNVGAAPSMMEKFRTGSNSFGNVGPPRVKIELSATPELQQVINIKKGQTSFSDVDVFTTGVAQQVSE